MTPRDMSEVAMDNERKFAKSSAAESHSLNQPYLCLNANWALNRGRPISYDECLAESLDI